MIPHIPILLGSCRVGRQSERVAHWMLDQLQADQRLHTQLIDLAAADLPMLMERAHPQQTPPANVKAFCDQLHQADGLLIVTPEYKGSYPGVLKNAMDHLEPQALQYKPVGICTVSAGGFGGVNCLAQLRLLCLALGGMPIPTALPVSQVRTLFNGQGQLTQPDFPGKFEILLQDLLWYTEAMVHQRRRTLTATE